MPFLLNEELPASVRRHLPDDAQTVYREVFNHAYSLEGATYEEHAHRVAWAAVKRRYEKIGERWVARPLMIYSKPLRAPDD